jgi:hypothetical protein
MIAMLFPPSPVTPLTCFKQAAFSSVISSEGADLGDSSSVEPSVDDAPLVILEKKLDRTGVDGTLFVAVAFAGVFFVDALFEDSVREGLGLEGASFDDELFEGVSFDDELFEGFDFGDFVIVWGVQHQGTRLSELTFWKRSVSLEWVLTRQVLAPRLLEVHFSGLRLSEELQLWATGVSRQLSV